METVFLGNIMGSEFNLPHCFKQLLACRRAPSWETQSMGRLIEKGAPIGRRMRKMDVPRSFGWVIFAQQEAEILIFEPLTYPIPSL